MPMDDARERLLAQYLDGSLTGEGLEAFERQIAHDAALRAEVASLRGVDDALRRNYAHTPAITSAQILAMAASIKPVADSISFASAAANQASNASSAARPAFTALRKLGMAAAFALGIFGMWLVWQQVKPDPTASMIQGPPPVKTAGAYYNNKVVDGFEPDWVCDDDAEFAATFRDRFGQALALKPATGSTKMLGVSYARLLSPHTVAVLGESDGKAVLVLIDKIENDNQEVVFIDCASLRVNRKEIGSLVLYEINTLPEARMLDLFVAAD